MTIKLPRQLGWWLVLIGLTLVAYANSFRTGLPLDNRVIILTDPRIREFTTENLWLIFNENYWWPHLASDLYRPLTTFSYLIDYAVLGHGTSPWGYHVTNLVVHVLNVLLVWRILRRLQIAETVAWLAAAIFAVHPLGVEAVTNVVGRADLFATLAILLTAWAWLTAEMAETGRRALGWRVVAGAVALLGVLTKENAVMAVAAIGLLAVWQRGWRIDLRYWLTRVLPTVAPAALLFLTLRLIVRIKAPPIGQIFVNNPIAGAGPWEGFMTAVKVLGHYVGLLVWPDALSCDHCYPQIPLYGSGGWQDAQSWLVLAGFAGMVWALWRWRAPLVAGGLVWGGVMMLPTSNLLVSIGSIMADRFLYLPLTGLSLVLALALVHAGRWLAERVKLNAVWAPWILAICVLVALTARTLVRNTDWTDDRTLWLSALKVTPNSFNVRKGVAEVLFGDGLKESDADAAIAEGERGLALLESPPLSLARQDNTLTLDLGRYYRVKGELCAGRGDMAAARRNYERSLAMLEKALAKDRWVNAEARRVQLAHGRDPKTITDLGNYRIYGQLALTQVRLARQSAAVGSLHWMRHLNPFDTMPPFLLGLLAAERRDWDMSAVWFLQVVLLDPSHTAGWQRLSEVYVQLGIKPAPVTERGKNHNLDVSSRRVQAQLNTALQDLVRSLRAAKQFESATHWVDRAMKEFRCDPVLFADQEAKPIQ